jgi:hypothetical protein
MTMKLFMKARFLLLLLCVGCTVSKTQYNLVVPQSTNIEYLIQQNKQIEKKYCMHFLFGLLPVSRMINVFNTAKYTQKTIEYYNKQGFDGNVLVDVTFKNQSFFIPLVWTAGCLKIEGTMATLKQDTKI